MTEREADIVAALIKAAWQRNEVLVSELANQLIKQKNKNFTPMTVGPGGSKPPSSKRVDVIKKSKFTKWNGIIGIMTAIFPERYIFQKG